MKKAGTLCLIVFMIVTLFFVTVRFTSEPHRPFEDPKGERRADTEQA
jgi:hypothetical protein